MLPHHYNRLSKKKITQLVQNLKIFRPKKARVDLDSLIFNVRHLIFFKGESPSSSSGPHRWMHIHPDLGLDISLLVERTASAEVFEREIILMNYKTAYSAYEK